MDEILEKSLIMVKDHPIHEPVTDPTSSNEGVIRLFKHSTPGIMLDHIGKLLSLRVFFFFLFPISPNERFGLLSIELVIMGP